jgi:hypothetical protein
MIETILYFGMLWILIGFIAAFVDIFVFFRGIKHMIDCHVNHKDLRLKHAGMILLANYNAGHSISILISFFIIFSILGPITVYILIRDFIKFTFV